MDVDQRVVVHDQRLVGLDEAHAAHVGGEGVHMVDVLNRGLAVLPPAQIADDELVGLRLLVLRPLDVDPAYPETAVLERIGQMVTDEATCPSHQYADLLGHVGPPVCYRSPSARRTECNDGSALSLTVSEVDRALACGRPAIRLRSPESTGLRRDQRHVLRVQE